MCVHTRVYVGVMCLIWSQAKTRRSNRTEVLASMMIAFALDTSIERFRGTIFRAKIRMGATDFFQACSIRFFGTENPCGLAFIRTMFRMEILRHRVQKDFSRTNLVRETSIFRGKF